MVPDEIISNHIDIVEPERYVLYFVKAVLPTCSDEVGC